MSAGMDALRATLAAIDPAEVEQQHRVEILSRTLAMLVREHIPDVTRIQEGLAKVVREEHPVFVLFCLHVLTANVRRGMIASRAPGMLDLDAACAALAQEMSDFSERTGAQ
jgi:hypothetical protein